MFHGTARIPHQQRTTLPTLERMFHPTHHPPTSEITADVTELEKALRMVEKRRGELLGVVITPGRPAENVPRVGRSPADLGVPKQTASRYRKIARHWDDLIWPRREFDALRAARAGCEPLSNGGQGTPYASTLEAAGLRALEAALELPNIEGDR